MSEQEIEDLADKLQQSIEELNSNFDQKHQDLINEIKRLKKITCNLEATHRECTTGSLVGSSMGVAGGITALAGLALSFFTFGISLAVSGVGAVVGVAGGVTGAVYNITNMVKQSNLRENIKKIINDFQNTINPMIQHLSTISTTIEKLQQVGQSYSIQNKVIMTSVRSTKTLSTVTKLFTILQTAKIGKTAAKAATTLKTVAKLSGAISGLLLVLDAYSIYCDSIELSEMSQPTGQKQVEEIKSETLKFIYQMRETAAQFQEIVDEIKSARDAINEQLQIS